MLLNDLPFDILAEVDDVGALANAALSCRELYQVVYDPKQTMWKAMHDRLYDSPAQASAYLPNSHTGQGWRSRVIDRDFTTRYILRHEELFQQLQQDFGDIPDLADDGRWKELYPANRDDAWLNGFFKATARIMTTVLELYHELPPPSCLSLNTPLILQIASCLSFQFMLTQIRPDLVSFSRKLNDVEEAERGHTSVLRWQLRCRFISLPPFRVQDEKRLKTVLRGLPAPNVRPRDRWTVGGWTYGPAVNWGDLRGVMSEMLGDRFTDEGLDGARGPGCIDIPPRPSQKVWDWAGVGGNWRAKTTDMSYQHVVVYDDDNLPDNQPVRFDGRFDLVAVAGLQEIRDAFGRAVRARNVNEDEYHIDLIPFHLKKIEDELSDALPPIYFHSTSFAHDPVNTSPTRWYDPMIEPRPAMFIYGMVNITRDSPPEMIWTMTAEAIGYPRESQLMRGVFAGGRLSPLGVLGTWNFKRKIYGPNPELYEDCFDGLLDLGTAWITRMED